MQYYIKIFNKNTNELVGYYKETGSTCITRLPKGMKCFNTAEQALLKSLDIDEGFIRDRDGHYYTATTAVYGDHTRQAPKETYKTKQEKEVELKDALDTFIRKNSSRNTEQTGD